MLERLEVKKVDIYPVINFCSIFYICFIDHEFFVLDTTHLPSLTRPYPLKS